MAMLNYQRVLGLSWTNVDDLQSFDLVDFVIFCFSWFMLIQSWTIFNLNTSTEAPSDSEFA